MKVRPGELLGIMGTSGAGKSSLLDILALRSDVKSGRVSGVVEYISNGFRLSREEAAQCIRYVLQEPVLLPTETVRETLLFCAHMRTQMSTGDKDIADRVQHCMELLEIDHIADSRIGRPDIGGLSGGERKRLAIGCELVTEPRVLLLDEPTSGKHEHAPPPAAANVIRGVHFASALPEALCSHFPAAVMKIRRAPTSWWLSNYHMTQAWIPRARRQS